MINILHTIDTTGPGGAETVFVQLASMLDREIFVPHVLIAGKGWVYDQLRQNGIMPTLIDSKGSFNVKYLWHLIRFIKKHKINIIHSHLLGSNVYCSLAGLLCRVPVVSSFHGLVDTHENDYLLNLRIRIISWGSKKIVYVSRHLKKYFEETTIVSKTKAQVIYNGIDLNHYMPCRNINLRKELGVKSDEILIGSIGNIRKAKGYDILLQAAALINKKRSDCKFVIVGEGTGKLFDDLLQMRRELDLEGTVFFSGFRKNVCEVINNFDIFLLSSTSEGFSIATIEAMACGVPVIVTKSGGPEEIVSHGVNGICVESNNANAIANALHGLMLNGGKKKILANNALATVYLNFSVLNTLRRYSGLYIETAEEQKLWLI